MLIISKIRIIVRAILLALLIFPIISFAENTANNSQLSTVNILTWWGYLRSPAINKLVRDTCHVNISYDEYYSEEEFLRRFTNNKEYYDIIIFSHPLYNFIKAEIALPNNDLWKQSLGYAPILKQHYQNDHLAPNVVYFLYAFSGILWNPKLVNIEETDTLQEMFVKAGSNIVLLPDDVLDMVILLNQNIYSGHAEKANSPPLTVDNFTNFVKASKVYIANDYKKIIASPNFAFAFTESGQAFVISMLANVKNYQFMLHPKLSYVSVDLLAVLNNRKNVNCVAKVLTGETAGSIFQNEIYYFSPYGKLDSVENKDFRNFYRSFLQKLPSLPWMQPLSIEKFKKLKITWDLIKIKLMVDGHGN